MDVAGKRILIVDDDPDIRASLRVFLTAAGYLVEEAGTGEEGLCAATLHMPDAVFADLMMEEVNAGTDMALKLREIGFQGPLFLMSAAGAPVRENISPDEYGLSRILQKPVAPAFLLEMLTECLGSGA